MPATIPFKLFICWNPDKLNKRVYSEARWAQTPRSIECRSKCKEQSTPWLVFTYRWEWLLEKMCAVFLCRILITMSPNKDTRLHRCCGSSSGSKLGSKQESTRKFLNGYNSRPWVKHPDRRVPNTIAPRRPPSGRGVQSVRRNRGRTDNVAAARRLRLRHYRAATNSLTNKSKSKAHSSSTIRQPEAGEGMVARRRRKGIKRGERQTIQIAGWCAVYTNAHWQRGPRTGISRACSYYWPC